MEGAGSSGLNLSLPASLFSGLLSSGMVVSIRDLLGMDGFGSACLWGDFSFFLVISYFLLLPW